MPATMNAITTDGPARSAIAAAVRTNRPAPMIAPMPRATSANGPSVRFSVPSPLDDASASRRSIDFVRKSALTCPPDVATLYAEPRQPSSGERPQVVADARLGIAGRQQVAD